MKSRATAGVLLALAACGGSVGAPSAREPVTSIDAAADVATGNDAGNDAPIDDASDACAHTIFCMRGYVIDWTTCACVVAGADKTPTYEIDANAGEANWDAWCKDHSEQSEQAAARLGDGSKRRRARAPLATRAVVEDRSRDGK